MFHYILLSTLIWKGPDRDFAYVLLIVIRFIAYNKSQL